MVRLRGICSRKYRTFSALFQFQNGTIKSRRSGFVYCSKVYFNSKMVRLRVNQRREGGCNYLYFNSKMVRLRELKLQIRIAGKNFNSKMVRLRGQNWICSWNWVKDFNSKMVRLRAIACSIIYVGQQFQFQNGTIKSLR